MTQDQNIAIATATLAVIVVGGIVIGVLQPDVTPIAPSPVVAGSAMVETTMNSMPATGWTGIDSPPVAPGDSATVIAQLPAEWTWGGHVALLPASVDKFTVANAHVETHSDGSRWFVADVTNTSAAPARLDGSFDFVSTAPAIDAGIDGSTP